MLSRRFTILLPATWLCGRSASAQSVPAGVAASGSLSQPSALWFDPTQLPSYNGRLERWVADPSGAVARGLLREGTQFVFSASEAEGLMLAIAPGAPIWVWGIRARNAPVVLMLAWGRSEAQPANFVERPAWFINQEAGHEPLRLSGRILCPLLTPRGEGMGVILEEGGSIRLPVAVHRALGDLLKVGEPIAAEGRGTRRDGVVALDATAIGREAARLQPVTPP